MRFRFKSQMTKEGKRKSYTRVQKMQFNARESLKLEKKVTGV